MKPTRCVRWAQVILGGLLAQATMAQDVAPMEFRDRATGEIRNLDHWQGQVVVLDFFAYWCAPCRPASAKIEAELVSFYRDAGHPHGTPVTVLAVNVEAAKPSRTQAFIEQLGLSHVVDDIDGSALESLGARGLPFLAVLDGTAVTSEGGQWRLLYRHNGLESIRVLREHIDAVGAEAGGAR